MNKVFWSFFLFFLIVLKDIFVLVQYVGLIVKIVFIVDAFGVVKNSNPGFLCPVHSV
jgi:hypothetical protein